MTLKEYLENNLQKIIDLGCMACIKDEEYMQGVDLLTNNPDAKVYDIINDKPVQKFWDYIVTGVEREDNVIYIGIVEKLSSVN